MKRLMIAIALVSLAPFALAHTAPAEPVKILAAENFYADIAAQIGGNYVRTSAVLSNPDQDPHLFEASPSVARDVKNADLVLLNGAGYDDWMTKLLAASKNPNRKIIEMAQLTGVKSGENPHIWYDVARVQTLAGALTESLSTLDPAHSRYFADNLSTFSASLSKINQQIQDFKQHHPQTRITASEPVFGYMAQSLGLEMTGLSFQMAIMNNTEPAVSDVAAFEKSLKNHEVKAMLYNAQASSPSVERLKKIALVSKVPVVPITETEPAKTTYQAWMAAQISALDAALTIQP
eukprot:gene16869-17055_t